MNHQMARISLIFIAVSLLVSCKPSTTKTIPPTNTPFPATHTLLPDTPTLEPIPTDTSVPFGTFKGCIYFEGKLVDGKIQLKDTNSGYEYDTNQVGPSGCITKKIAPGYYEIVASYWQGPCASGPKTSGCWADRVSFEMEPNGLFEMDFETIIVDESK